jgi:hypothetical protein
MQRRKPKIPGWVPALGIVAGMLAAVFVLLVLIQLIPYGRDHTNPQVVAEPNWDSAETRELAQRACFDCHSNETVWPIYSSIAPISWLVAMDVANGRESINFSDWTPIPGLETEEIGAVILEGEMPPGPYLLLHPNARLTPEEAQKLADGLAKSLMP